MVEARSGDECPPEEGLEAASSLAVGGSLIGVFAKHWTPGATKTRLAAAIGDRAAAEASRCFLDTTLERLSDTRFDTSEHLVAFTPSDKRNAFAALPAVASGAWHHEPQKNNALGERMKCFFESALRSHSAVVLVGTDSPDMPLEAVADGLCWLNEGENASRLVLGPTEDGGYWLIGIRGKLPPIFGEMPWSQPNLMETTVERLNDAGWSQGHDYRLLSPWYDVDEVADLQRLRSGLRAGDPALVQLADKLDALLGLA